MLMHASKFVESYFEAWNHNDPVAVAGHLADDGLYCDIPQNEQRTHNEFIVYLKGFFSTYRHRYELIGEILHSENTIAFQYRMYPLGKVGNSDATGIYTGAEFISLNGDAAATITDFYDIPDVAQARHPGPQVPRVAHRRKYAKSGLSDHQMLEYKERLQTIMLSQQVYLRSDLTLPKLAAAIECSVNHLSQVINAGFGMSFFDFVNRFRIDHAMELLSDIDGQCDAVLNVAFKVGFNSNSAFYTAFKKYVGKTPAQFRRSQVKKAH
jgi:AraC-like DNA-binding protein